MIKNKRIKNKVMLLLLIGILIELVLLPLFLISKQAVPQIFNIFYGERIINQTLDNITGNLTDADSIARSIMKWEKEYFYNPYPLWNPNSTLQKVGIYNINGSYKWFVRDAPVSWIIFSRLANCEEYANVFVYLMNKKGIESRIVHTVGEDHTWAEYYSDGYKIAADPSQNKVLDKKKFAKGKNWSYIESINIFNTSDRKDVSEEYIERGKLNIYVTYQNNPIEGANVAIKSPYLMKVYPERYRKPKDVLSNITDKNGKVSFKLGGKEYIVEVKNAHSIFGNVYTKNITVVPNKEVSLTFDLSKET